MCGSPPGASTVITSSPALSLFRCATQGTGPFVTQSGSRPSNSLLAWVSGTPFRVANGVAEPQQMLKSLAPFGFACCTSALSRVSVITSDRAWSEKLITPPNFVHDSSGKPPAVATSASLFDPAAATAEPDVPPELTVPLWQDEPGGQFTTWVPMSNGADAGLVVPTALVASSSKLKPTALNVRLLNVATPFTAMTVLPEGSGAWFGLAA